MIDYTNCFIFLIINYEVNGKYVIFVDDYLSNGQMDLPIISVNTMMSTKFPSNLTL